ncbi:hypothetical protein [Flavobacterium restrictum]|uniref:Uncharacterized protein n=1 Tax=Flavobacterium restrictum TaxID=2594428 RepID=A0A553DXR8_9FLAO|nr:hypothetical protein [Flavobacterium restrictum]TRX37546.1 hypothetical protein FNW21_12235 [Flavobacterium restrictum]
MKNANQTEILQQTIALLEEKQKNEFIALKLQFQETYDSLKPLNLLKSAFTEMTTAPVIKNNLVNNAIGLATGYLSKRVLFGTSLNPIKRVVGTLLQFIVSNVVTKEVNTSKLLTLKE